MKKAGLGSRERELIDQFSADERAVVSADDVLKVWPVSRIAANTALSRLARKGWLQRLKRGAYTVVPLGSLTDTPAMATAWPIAMELFGPSYISGWSAAEHWGLTDQIFNTISVVTTKPQRNRDQRIGGIRFRTHTLPEKKLFGTVNVWFGSSRVIIADPHRTMIDILDTPEFGGGGRHMLDIAKAYWTSSMCDSTKILEYAKRFSRGTVFKRLGLTAERYGNPSEEWLQQCKKGLSQGISLLDPNAPNAGPIRSQWKIRVNIPMEEQ